MKLLSSVISALTVLLALTESSLANEQQYSNFGPVPVNKNGFQNVPAHADMGFYAFSFGSAKTFAFQSFNFKLKKAAFLSITDCYCPGDTFQVFDNGVPLLVTMNPEDAPFDCTPPFYNSTAWECFTDSYHAKASSLLNPGYHNITIAAINSITSGGTGFIRVDTSCTPSNVQPVPCCWIEGPTCEDTLDPNCFFTPGRLCNQMVNYP